MSQMACFAKAFWQHGRERLMRRSGATANIYSASLRSNGLSYMRQKVGSKLATSDAQNSAATVV